MSRIIYLLFIFFTIHAEEIPLKKKVLMFTFGKYGGHWEVVRPIQKMLSTNRNLIVDIADAWDNNFNHNKDVHKTYVWIMQHCPWVMHISHILCLQEMIFSKQYKKEAFDIIKNYDLIILCCPIIQLYCMDIIKKNNLNTRIITVITDMDDVRKKNWIHHPNQIYIVPNEKLYLKANQKRAQIVKKASGLPIGEDFLNIRNISKVEMKKSLGMDKPLIFVCFGSAGSSQMEQIAKVLKNEDRYDTIFVCGKNESIRQNIKKHNSNYTVLGYVSNIHEYLRAADIFIGKPGPGCITEAIQCEAIPIVKNGFDVMPQEKECLEYIKDKYGLVINTYRNLSQAITKALDNKEFYISNMSRLENNALNEVCQTAVEVLNNLEEYQKKLYLEDV